MRSQHIVPAALLALTLLVMGGCAKNPVTEANAAAKRYFDAWLQLNHPDATPTGIGIYIIEQTEGSGTAYSSDATHAMVRYTIRNLEGKISETNFEAVAQQLGTFNSTYYYGPKVLETASQFAGVEAALSGMRIGGRRKVIIPSWLMSRTRYDSAAEYLQHETGNANAIYDIELCDFTSDIYQWEVDSIVGYVARHMDGIDSTYVGGDTTAQKYGFYYQLLRESPDTVTIPSDSTFYINYTGRLLNGQVFDTTIEDTAKVYGIYSASRTYGPVSCTKGEKYTDVKLNVDGGSATTVVNGFGGAIFLMQPYEKARVAFYSTLGYGAKGGLDTRILPPYSPLCFEIELVDPQ